MSKGRLTVWIDGREALPVRAIPYTTGWQYSPDILVECFAHAAALHYWRQAGRAAWERSILKKKGVLLTPWKARAVAPPFEKLRSLIAYHRQAGKPRAIMACEWNGPLAAIKGFEAELRERRPGIEAIDDHIGYAYWRKESVLKLPAGVFVWLDEFVHEHNEDRKRGHDDELLTFTPLIESEEMRAAIMEGFEDCPRRPQEADRAMISRADFVAICRVDDLGNFGGFRVQADGLYVYPPIHDAEDEEDVSEGSTRNQSEPALPLPCTLGQVQAFLSRAGLSECLDEEAVGIMFGERPLLPDDVHIDGGESTALTKHHEPLSISEQVPTQQKEKQLKSANWIDLVQAEATRIFAELYREGVSPKKNRIIGRLVQWAANQDPPLRGPSGRPLSCANIERYGLRSWQEPSRSECLKRRGNPKSEN